MGFFGDILPMQNVFEQFQFRLHFVVKTSYFGWILVW